MTVRSRDPRGWTMARRSHTLGRFAVSVCGLSVLLLALLGVRPALAQDDDALAGRQAGVANRYQQLENLLLRLADVEAAENPERSALLRRAARQSRDKFILDRMRDASSSLQSQQFQDALDNQKEASQELSSLLKLLLSEDRSSRIRDEKERITKIIKELRRTERAQRSTRARTENGADLDEVQQDQSSITKRSEDLRDELSDEGAESTAGESADADAEQEPPTGEGADADDSSAPKTPTEPTDSAEPTDSGESGESGEGSESESPSDSGENQPADSPSESGKPDESGSPPSANDSEPQPGQQGQSQQGQPQQGEPQQAEPQQAESESGQPSSGQPQTPQQQAEQQLKAAIERMQQAEQELEDAQRDPAIAKQREAEEKLRSAIDQLERILRQLREEEMQRELARLESRLKKMAVLQSRVLEECQTLAATPKSQRNRQTDLKAGDLAFEEKKITLEADRAMLLLREEGSSVAFPEVISQIRAETVRVTERLGESKVDAVTQGIQEDILVALEEMISALQKAQRDLEQQRQQQQQGQPQPQSPGEQPLVQSLAELKLLRTMETQIKSTTERYSGLMESGETSGEEVRPLLQSLSDRQDRLYRITRDLVLRRNQ